VALCGREGRQQKTRGQGKRGEGDGKMGRKGKKEGRTCSIDSRGIDAPGRWGGCAAGGRLTVACAGSADNKPLSVTSFTKADRKVRKMINTFIVVNQQYFAVC